MDSLSPVNVNGLGSGVRAITAGRYQTCALLTTGGVKCWGSNSVGQLGNGTDGTTNSPVDVSGLTSGVTAISAGERHTCALLTSGGVKCWGSNLYGQLGNGLTTGYSSNATPVDVTGLTSGVTAITTGGQNTCALLVTGGVKCWGLGTGGQLGFSEPRTNAATPVDVAGLTSGVTAIATGEAHSCALLNSGGIKCWGFDGYGQLGSYNPSTDEVLGINFTKIATGNSPLISYTTTSVQDPTKSCTVTAPATECNIDGLTIGQTYTFTVTATNAIGTSSPSVPSDPITIF